MNKKRVLWIFGIGVIGIVFGVLVIIADVQLRFLSRIHAPADISSLDRVDAAMILGASVKADNTPSDALRDRLLVGKQLYDEQKAGKLLITGDDGSYRADEIPVMRSFLVSQGIPEKDIIADGQGYRTYESCKRAKTEYGITKTIIVTQRFHIARALYLCNALGVDSIGVTSDLQTYIKNVDFWIRDLAASFKAWIDLKIWPPSSPVSS